MTAHASHSLAAGPGEPQRRVLLVDDEGTIRQALRRFFQRQGWHVDEADDGGAALALLLDGAPEDAYDVIISDLRMPGVSGIEMHERLRGGAARPARPAHLLHRRLGLARGRRVPAARRLPGAATSRSSWPTLRELVHRMIAS